MSLEIGRGGILQKLPFIPSVCGLWKRARLWADYSLCGQYLGLLSKRRVMEEHIKKLAESIEKLVTAHEFRLKGHEDHFARHDRYFEHNDKRIEDLINVSSDIGGQVTVLYKIILAIFGISVLAFIWNLIFPITRDFPGFG